MCTVEDSLISDPDPLRGVEEDRLKGTNRVYIRYISEIQQSRYISYLYSLVVTIDRRELNRSRNKPSYMSIYNNNLYQ